MKPKKRHKMKNFLTMSAGPIVNPTPTTPPVPPPVGQGTLGIFYLVPAYHQEPAPDVGTIPGVTNDYMQGLLLRETWERLERTDGVLDFDWLDDSIDACETNDKLVGFQNEPGINSPDWFFEAYPDEVLHLTDPSALLCPVPWGTNFQTGWETVQTELATRYSGRIAYNVIQGIGRASESFLVNASDEAAATALAISSGYADLRTAWKAGVQWMIDMHVRVWDPVPVILVTGTPYPTGGVTDLQLMFDYGDAAHRGKFGARANDLSANGPQPGQPSAKIISQVSPHCVAVGYQFKQAQKTNDTHPPTRLGLACDRGIGYGAHFLEMFAADADDPLSVPVLISATERLFGAT